LGQILDKHPIT